VFNPTVDFDSINIDQYQLISSDLKEFSTTKLSKFASAEEKKKNKIVQKVVELNFADIDFIDDLNNN